MNAVDALCTSCGRPTRYDCRLPILCAACRIKAQPGVKRITVKKTKVAA